MCFVVWFLVAKTYGFFHAPKFYGNHMDQTIPSKTGMEPLEIYWKTVCHGMPIHNNTYLVKKNHGGLLLSLLFWRLL
jgi:hypothetical protein